MTQAEHQAEGSDTGVVRSALRKSRHGGASSGSVRPKTLRANDSPGPPAVRPGRLIDRSDRELLGFTISWLPYGYVPEDELLVRFGLTNQRFADRLREIVCGQRDFINPRIAGRLIELCERIDGAAAQPRVAPVGGLSSS